MVEWLTLLEQWAWSPGKTARPGEQPTDRIRDPRSAWQDPNAAMIGNHSLVPSIVNTSRINNIVDCFSKARTSTRSIRLANSSYEQVTGHQPSIMHARLGWIGSSPSTLFPLVRRW